MGNWRGVIIGFLGFEKEEKMKVKSRFVCKVFLGIVLIIFVCWLSGCSQPGETTEEGRIRHIRNLTVNQQELTRDVDRALLFDKPSTLTDKKLP
jgi:hypothetical protein